MLTEQVDKKEEMMRGRRGKSAIGTVLAIVFCIIVVGFIMGSCGGHSSVPSTTTPSSTQPVATSTVAPTDYKKWVQWTVERELGAESNLKGPRVSSVSFVDGDESQLAIGIVPDDNLTHALIRFGMLQDAGKVFQAIFGDSRANTVTIGMLRPMIDTYGNNKLTLVIGLQMTRTTFQKINWENMLPDKLPLAVDAFDETPGWE